VFVKVVEFEFDTITPPNAELPTEYVVPLAGLVGGVEVEVLTTRYPVGTEAEAVNDPETEPAKEESVSDVGWAVGDVQGTGGVQVYLLPLPGHVVIALFIPAETVEFR